MGRVVSHSGPHAFRVRREPLVHGFASAWPVCRAISRSEAPASAATVTNPARNEWPVYRSGCGRRAVVASRFMLTASPRASGPCSRSHLSTARDTGPVVIFACSSHELSAVTGQCLHEFHTATISSFLVALRTWLQDGQATRGRPEMLASAYPASDNAKRFADTVSKWRATAPHRPTHTRPRTDPNLIGRPPECCEPSVTLNLCET